MSVEGRISVDVLFHDKDGTNAVNVVSLSAADGYTSGKVAVVSGQCGTSPVFIDTFPTAYRGADGQQVYFSTVNRVALSSTSTCMLKNNEELGETIISNSGMASASAISVFSNSLYVQKVDVAGESNTTSYTLVIYGT